MPITQANMPIRMATCTTEDPQRVCDGAALVWEKARFVAMGASTNYWMPYSSASFFCRIAVTRVTEQVNAVRQTAYQRWRWAFLWLRQSGPQPSPS